MKDKKENCRCGCDSCTGKLDAEKPGRTLTPEERLELGQALTDLVQKYTGMKRGLVQAVNIHAEIDEPTNITVDILL